MTGADGAGYTILVVDDEPEVRASTAMLLEALDFAVLEAGDPASALALLADHPEVDLLLSDFVLPGDLDGAGLCSAALEARPGLKVLLTTGRTELAAGTGFPVIAKPFRMAEIDAAIDGLLNQIED